MKSRKTEQVQAERTQYTEDFLRFWKVYPPQPNHSKYGAFLAWNKALEAGYQAEEIIEGARCHRLVRLSEPPEYTQHASTWLSLTWEKGRGWEAYEEDHWTKGADALTVALIAELKLAWADPRNENRQSLVFRAVFSKFAKNSWADHASMPVDAREKIVDADYRLRELGATAKPFTLKPSEKPDWSWEYPKEDDDIADFFARRIKLKETQS